VEWFLSDAPARLYKEFAEAHRHHKLIKHLETSAGGFEKVLHKWLGARSKILLALCRKTWERTRLTVVRGICSPHSSHGGTQLRDLEINQILNRSDAEFSQYQVADP
jgi:hypothetical protein